MSNTATTGAMILAAGFGSRLGELTKTTPKPLMKIGGKSILEWVLLRIKAAGVSTAVVNAHHLADQVEKFLVEAGPRLGMELIFSYEKQILGTGGGVKAAAKLLHGCDSFFVYNADVYSEFELAKLSTFHQEQGGLAALVVSERATDRVLLFDAQNRLCGWRNKSTGKERIVRNIPGLREMGFNGIHIVSDRIFSYMERCEGEFTIFDPYLRAVEDGCQIYGYRLQKEYWIDIGRPQDLEKLRLRLGE
jgi:NDP-sugar pyrophosphorylase family protein